MKKSMKIIAFFLCLFVLNSSAQDKTVKIKTSAICGECKKTIETALNYTKGIQSANLDVDSKEVTVIYKNGKTDPDKIRIAISKAGYDADSIPADPKAYSRLKPCCKKKENK